MFAHFRLSTLFAPRAFLAAVRWTTKRRENFQNNSKSPRADGVFNFFSFPPHFYTHFDTCKHRPARGAPFIWWQWQTEREISLLELLRYTKTSGRVKLSSSHRLKNLQPFFSPHQRYVLKGRALWRSQTEPDTHASWFVGETKKLSFHKFLIVY